MFRPTSPRRFLGAMLSLAVLVPALSAAPLEFYLFIERQTTGPDLSVDASEADSTVPDPFSSALPVLSFSTSLSTFVSSPSEGPNRSVSIPSFTELEVSLPWRSVLPLIGEDVAVGTVFEYAVLVGVEGSGPGFREVMRIEIGFPVISSFEISGASGDSEPTMDILLDFTDIVWRYYPDSSDPGVERSGGYDLSGFEAISVIGAPRNL